MLVALTGQPDGRLRLTRLGHELGWEKSRISHQVKRMAERGLVEKCRSGDDGRGAVVQVSPLGRQRIEAAAPSHVEAVRRLFVDRLDTGPAGQPRPSSPAPCWRRWWPRRPGRRARASSGERRRCRWASWQAGTGRPAGGGGALGKALRASISWRSRAKDVRSKLRAIRGSSKWSSWRLSVGKGPGSTSIGPRVQNVGELLGQGDHLGLGRRSL